MNVSSDLRKSSGKKVLVAISGGIDSAVTAALLAAEGYQVIGLHLRLGTGVSENIKKYFNSNCLKQKDEESIRRLCAKLGIPLHVVDASEAFCAHVVDHSIHQSLQMRKVNPCIPCHQRVKIGFLMEKADELGCEWVGTGHYARVSLDLANPERKVAQLRKATDLQNDQSHLLFETPQKHLSRMLMPLGGISKKMVIKLAREFDLLGEDELEGSRRSCLHNGPVFWALIDSQVAPSFRPVGMIRTASGQLLGEHNGLYRHSIGEQWETSNISQGTQQEGYVVGFDLANQTLIVGSRADLFQKTFIVSDSYWVKAMEGMQGISCTALIGNRAEEVSCRVTFFEAGISRVEFIKPLYAINPGEPIVFYDGDDVLGGGSVQSFPDPSLDAPKSDEKSKK